MTLRLTILSLLALSLPACGDDKNNSTGDSTGGSGSASTGEATDSTIGMSSSPTTGDTDTSAGSGSQSASGTTTSATTADSAGSATSVGTDTGTTGGDPDPAVAALCASVCARFIECMVMDDVDTCTAECTGELGFGEAMCIDTSAALLACVGEMTCEQIGLFLNDEDPGPCIKEFAAQGTACMSNECTGSVGSNEQGTECSISSECPNQPVLEMTCDATTCTCTEGGAPTGECPADGVCMDIAGISAKAEACCGF